jgi:predicted DNA binding CopG/RHH family protein
MTYAIITAEGDIMAKAATTAKDKYNAKAYEDIRLRVKAGQKQLIKSRAETLGMSLQGYINNLIEQDMERK